MESDKTLSSDMQASHGTDQIQSNCIYDSDPNKICDESKDYDVKKLSDMDVRARKRMKRKRKKYAKLMNITDSGKNLKEILDADAGFQGWRRFGISSKFDEEDRCKQVKPLSERFGSLSSSDTENLTKAGTSDSRFDSAQDNNKVLETIDDDIIREEVNKIPFVINLSVSKARYKRMGLPPPAPMPQSLVDRYYNSKVKEQDSKMKRLSVCKTEVSSMEEDLKGLIEARQIMEKSLLQDSTLSDSDKEEKFCEIGKMFDTWTKMVLSGTIDKNTKERITVIKNYVQNLISTCDLNGESNQNSEVQSDRCNDNARQEVNISANVVKREVQEDQDTKVPKVEREGHNQSPQTTETERPKTTVCDGIDSNFEQNKGTNVVKVRDARNTISKEIDGYADMELDTSFDCINANIEVVENPVLEEVQKNSRRQSDTSFIDNVPNLGVGAYKIECPGPNVTGPRVPESWSERSTRFYSHTVDLSYKQQFLEYKHLPGTEITAPSSHYTDLPPLPKEEQPWVAPLPPDAPYALSPQSRKENATGIEGRTDPEVVSLSPVSGGCLLKDYTRASEHGDQQGRIKTAIDRLKGKTHENDPDPNERETRYSGSIIADSNRTGERTAHNVQQQGKNSEEVSKRSSEELSERKYKPQTTKQFHGRTLLMGRKIPPRNIPNEPLYLNKLYTSSGKPQVKPVDPRPQYYNEGGMAKRVAKEEQRQREQKNESVKETDNVSKEHSETFDRTVDKYVPYKLKVIEVPQISCGNLRSNPVLKKVTHSIYKSQTLGAELEKRVDTQLRVARFKAEKESSTQGDQRTGINSTGVLFKTERGNIKRSDEYPGVKTAVTIPVVGISKVDDPRVLNMKENMKVQHSKPLAKLSSSLTEARQQTFPDTCISSDDSKPSGGLLSLLRSPSSSDCSDGALALSSYDERAKMRREAELQLKLVKKKINALKQAGNVQKEDGELSSDSDSEEQQMPNTKKSSFDLFTAERVRKESLRDTVSPEDTEECLEVGNSDPWSNQNVDESGNEISDPWNEPALFTIRHHDQSSSETLYKGSKDKQAGHRDSRSRSYDMYDDHFDTTENSNSPCTDIRHDEPLRLRSNRQKDRSRSPDDKYHFKRSKTSGSRRRSRSRSPATSRSARKRCNDRCRKTRYFQSPIKVRKYVHDKYPGFERKIFKEDSQWEDENEEKVTVRIVNESDDEVTFESLSQSTDDEEIASSYTKPSNRIVEKVSTGNLNQATSFDETPAEGHEDLFKYSNPLQEDVCSFRSVCIVKKNTNMKKCDGRLCNVSLTHGANETTENQDVNQCKSKKEVVDLKADNLLNGKSRVRKVLSVSDGHVNSLKDTGEESRNERSTKKKKFFTRRKSVFNRLGSKENSPVYNIQKVKPVKRVLEIKNKNIYTDDTFGDININMTSLEDF